MTRPLTGGGVLVWLLGFFGVILAMNAWYITLSVRTFRGEDEQLPYLQGVAYNRTLARRAEQKALDWRAKVTLSRLPSGAARILVRLDDAAGRPLPDLTLAGVLRHPADETRDLSLSLKPVASGLYQAELPGVAPGAWDVALHAQGGAPFEMTERLWLR